MKKKKILRYLLVLSNIFLLINCNDYKHNCTTDKLEITKNDSILNLKRVILFQQNYWKRFEELAIQENKKELYRLSITNLMSRELEIYKVSKYKGEFIFEFKKYKSSPTLKTGESNGVDSLYYSDTRRIKRKEWNSLKEIVNKNCFWTIPIEKYSLGLDGESWMLEGVQPNKKNATKRQYHIVSRWSPEKSSFKIVCENIIKLHNNSAVLRPNTTH